MQEPVMIKKIREYLKKPLVTGIAGLILGLIIGLPILGWLIWPVQWYDAAPYHMRQDLQQDFLCMAVDSYAANSTNPVAQQMAILRYQEMGDKGSIVLSALLANPGLCQTTTLAAIQTYSTLVTGSGITSPVTTLQPTTSAGTTKTTEGGSVALLIILCVVTIAVGAALFYVFVLRNKKMSQGTKPTVRSEIQTPPAAPRGKSEEAAQDKPVSQFMTTYALGDDLYDDSFSIDAPTGEFLGECGVGISETIGVGDPKKVTGFEIWLFDKNDVQTVTKILMSQHAYNDPVIRQRMMSKGELILVEPGQKILLETATLQLEAKVIDASYGQGALPKGSFFDRMTLELDVWSKA
jgi:hypothetical protein